MDYTTGQVELCVAMRRVRVNNAAFADLYHAEGKPALLVELP